MLAKRFFQAENIHESEAGTHFHQKKYLNVYFHISFEFNDFFQVTVADLFSPVSALHNLSIPCRDFLPSSLQARELH